VTNLCCSGQGVYYDDTGTKYAPAPFSVFFGRGWSRTKGKHVLRKAHLFGKGFAVRSVLVVVGCALISAMWAIVMERIDFEHAETIAEVTKENSTLARTLEEHTTRTLLGIDQALHFIMYQYGQQGLALSIRKAIAEGEIDDSIFTDMSIIDEDGGPADIHRHTRWWTCRGAVRRRGATATEGATGGMVVSQRGGDEFKPRRLPASHARSGLR
jgi:hypothetical protein